MDVYQGGEIVCPEQSAGDCSKRGKKVSAVTGRSLAKGKMFIPDGKTGKIKCWLMDRQEDGGGGWVRWEERQKKVKKEHIPNGGCSPRQR